MSESKVNIDIYTDDKEFAEKVKKLVGPYSTNYYFKTLNNSEIVIEDPHDVGGGFHSCVKMPLKAKIKINKIEIKDDFVTIWENDD